MLETCRARVLTTTTSKDLSSILLKMECPDLVDQNKIAEMTGFPGKVRRIRERHLAPRNHDLVFVHLT